MEEKDLLINRAEMRWRVGPGLWGLFSNANVLKLGHVRCRKGDMMEMKKKVMVTNTNLKR